jgi:hypothetical protein
MMGHTPLQRQTGQVVLEQRGERGGKSVLDCDIVDLREWS